MGLPAVRDLALRSAAEVRAAYSAWSSSGTQACGCGGANREQFDALVDQAELRRSRRP